MNRCEQCGKSIKGFHVVLAYETGSKQFCDHKCADLYAGSRERSGEPPAGSKRDLKADLELCKKATPGPWNVQSFMANRARRYEIFDVQGECVGTLVDNQDNAEFITQAREGWPHAIERAMRAETLVRELVDVIDELRRQINECGLDGEMWEVYERAKEVLGE